MIGYIVSMLGHLGVVDLGDCYNVLLLTDSNFVNYVRNFSTNSTSLSKVKRCLSAWCYPSSTLICVTSKHAGSLSLDVQSLFYNGKAIVARVCELWKLLPSFSKQGDFCPFEIPLFNGSRLHFLLNTS